MSRYDISVVTPYHNVNNKMFDGCVESMKSQTIGFDRIEWVIVQHNCDAEHIAYTREKLGSYENVVLKELNNDCRTPSSPRNAGLDLVTSNYVAFLDGDDKFRPDTLERLVGYFAATKAQVIVFRREYELEFPDMLALSETVPWDTTREIIMPDISEGVENRIYNDFPFFVTNRAFERKFLTDNNIRFDEDFVIAEDCYFNLKTIHLAERMCFLPQLIGYNYFINSGSMLSSEKSDEEILHMLRNAQAVIEDALDYGLYANHIIICLSFVLSRYLGFPNVKMETRVKVRDVMEPYLKMTSPIPTGRFIEPFNTMMNILPFEILLNIKRFENTRGDIAMNGFEVLAGILKENAETHLGRRYHFADILSPRGYQSQVPLNSLDVYQPMIDVEKSIGDSRIYAAEKPRWYIRMLNDALMPVSAKQAAAYADVFCRQLRGRTVLVWAEDETPIVPSNCGTYTSSVAGVTVDEYCRKHRVTLDGYSRRFAVPYEVLFNMDVSAKPTAKYIMDRSYLKLLFAVSDSSVDQIVLFGSYDLGSLRDGIALNLRELADDIEAGKLLGGRTYHEAYLRSLAVQLRPDPERAAHLRALAERDDFTLRDIWTELSEITVISVHPTPETVTEFEGIPLKHAAISNEVGVIGAASDKDGIYALVRDTIFYEFIPENASPEDRPLLAEALRPGDRVRPVVTTDAGIYRLPLRAMIEVTGIENGTILFRPCR